MERELTGKQKKVLAYVISHIEDRGFPPTFREIGRAFRIASTNGVREHLKALENHYAHAAHREPALGGLRALYGKSWDRLSELNIAVLRWLLGEFGIKTPLRLSSDMRLPEEPTERLIEICRIVGATSYLAGAGARDYMDFGKFGKAGIAVEMQEFRHPVYRQCYEPFVPGLSAIDLILTCGAQSLHCLRSTRTSGEGND